MRRGRRVERGGERLVRKGDYVGGCFFKPEAVDGFINGINPGDRSDIMGRFPFSKSSVDEAVDFARQGARAWRRVPLADRRGAIRAFRDQLIRFQEALAPLITRETGKPVWEARQELVSTARALTNFVEQASVLLGGVELDGTAAFSERLPRGVIGAICPFNMPIRIPALQSAAAILSGNSIVLKPSKYAPGCGQAVAEIWDRCKLPRGVFNLVQGPGKVMGQRLVQHPDLSALLCTGSYATGRTIHQLCSIRPELPLFLQTGGKAAAIVLDDACVEQAAYEVMIGAFMTAGQRHNSTGRVIVTEGIYDDFISLLIHHTANLNIGYGLDDDVFMGPLITETSRSRYRKFARRLEKAGHRTLMEASSERSDKRGFYVRPAIYRIHWQESEPMLESEPPGPMLTVYKVSSWAEATALHNQLAFRPVTSLFTQPHSDHLPGVCDRLRTGALNINRSTIGSSFRLPSTGQGRSGNGHGAGLELLQQLSHSRAQLIETRDFESIPVLPGTNWRTETTGENTVELELDDDVTGDLELA
jgi:acyl-CoA reductase-like NAD-dependent aldehyde dehydrogenase